MRFCLMIEGQEGVTWERWLALARAGEELGFEGLFTSDHYLSVMGVTGRGSSDAWTILSALAARTDRIRLGTLVSPVTFRHPAVVAKAAATVDHVSGGRVEVGLGAGWWEEEHRTHGFPFPPDGTRMSMLAEQLEVVHGLFREPELTFRGDHYVVEECPFLPKPVQRPHPPIIVGGGGRPRIAALAARWADEFNTIFARPEEVRQRFARVRDAVGRAGRDQDTFTTSLMTGVVVGVDRHELERRVQRLVAARGSGGGGTADHLEQLDARGWITGTPERAAQRLGELEEAGVQRVMLQDLLVDDLDMLRLLAAEVFPAVR